MNIPKNINNLLENTQTIIKKAKAFQESLVASSPMQNLSKVQRELVDKEFEKLENAIKEIEEVKKLLFSMPISLSYIELKIKEYYITTGLNQGYEQNIHWFHLQLNTAYKFKELKVFDMREKET